MATQILGLQIQHDLLTAVLLEQRGGGRRIIAWGSCRLADNSARIDQVQLLLEELNWHGGRCVVGLPLSIVCLRNVIIPFTDRKKIDQVLPMELEDQLILSAGEQMIDSLFIDATENGSHLLVGTVEKAYLQQLTATLHSCSLHPQVMIPTVVALAGQCMASGAFKNNVLLVYVEMHGVSICVWQDEQILLLRRFGYPELLFSVQDQAGDQDGYAIIDREKAQEIFSRLCSEILLTIEYFSQNTGLTAPPEQIATSGLLQDDSWWSLLLTVEFGIPVLSVDLLTSCSVAVTGQKTQTWDPELYTSALALALSAQGKKQVTDTLNFFPGTLAGSAASLLSKKVLISASSICFLFLALVVAYLWGDYRSLAKQDAALKSQMRALFQQTFPDITRVVDPQLQMQAKLREVQAPDVAIPLFTGNKRVLNILADISSRIPRQLKLHVSRLVIDQEFVMVKGTTEAFNNVDVIKNSLASSSLYAAVKIVSATADKTKGQIRFELKLQLAEAS